MTTDDDERQERGRPLNIAADPGWLAEVERVRSERGWSKRQLAREAGVSAPTILRMIEGQVTDVTASARGSLRLAARSPSTNPHRNVVCNKILDSGAPRVTVSVTRSPSKRHAQRSSPLDKRPALDRG